MEAQKVMSTLWNAWFHCRFFIQQSFKKEAAKCKTVMVSSYRSRKYWVSHSPLTIPTQIYTECACPDSSLFGLRKQDLW